MAPPPAVRSPAYAKSILKVLFISLIFDLVRAIPIFPHLPRLITDIPYSYRLR